MKTLLVLALISGYWERDPSSATGSQLNVQTMQYGNPPMQVAQAFWNPDPESFYINASAYFPNLSTSAYNIRCYARLYSTNGWYTGESKEISTFRTSTGGIVAAGTYVNGVPTPVRLHIGWEYTFLPGGNAGWFDPRDMTVEFTIYYYIYGNSNQQMQKVKVDHIPAVYITP